MACRVSRTFNAKPRERLTRAREFARVRKRRVVVWMHVCVRTNPNAPPGYAMVAPCASVRACVAHTDLNYRAEGSPALQHRYRRQPE